MLVAQAIAENLMIVTTDEKVRAYAARTIEA
jgi:PIN domain nuclease of toxin-antitoxin system